LPKSSETTPKVRKIELWRGLVHILHLLFELKFQKDTPYPGYSPLNPNYIYFVLLRK